MATAAADVSWLTEVQEVRVPISHNRPLWVRTFEVKSGLTPTNEYLAERHPYCEFTFHFQGRMERHIGTEKMEPSPGYLMILGPGVPHRSKILEYPQRVIAIHFLPTLLFEMGPEGGGAQVLSRFTAPQSIRERIIPLPKLLREKMAMRFEQMAAEFKEHDLGFELQLRSLLMESLVEFLRWEKTTKRTVPQKSASVNWLQIEKTLRYIHEYYAEPIYVKQVARASGLSLVKLQSTFQEALGMSCVQYLRTYRISRAAALLSKPQARVTEVAFAVGFETFSHFNTSFRSFMGMSPTEYMRRASTQK